MKNAPGDLRGAIVTGNIPSSVSIKGFGDNEYQERKGVVVSDPFQVPHSGNGPSDSKNTSDVCILVAIRHNKKTLAVPFKLPVQINSDFLTSEEKTSLEN